MGENILKYETRKNILIFFIFLWLATIELENEPYFSIFMTFWLLLSYCVTFILLSWMYSFQQSSRNKRNWVFKFFLCMRNSFFCHFQSVRASSVSVECQCRQALWMWMWKQSTIYVWKFWSWWWRCQWYTMFSHRRNIVYSRILSYNRSTLILSQKAVKQEHK